MTRRKCTSVLALLAIAFLTAVIVVVWVQFGQGGVGIVRESTTNDSNVAEAMHTTIRMERIGNSRKKEFIPKTHLEEENSNIQYVKPIKISPLPLHDHDIIYDQLHNNNDKPILRHHSGHFRHQTAEIWDPHPQYQINAFGRKLLLELVFNSNVVSSDLQIIAHEQNFAQKVRHDSKLSGCLYTGKIKDDADSNVVVSLCNGMTGYIKTSESTYFIEPAETFPNKSPYTIIHRMQRLPHETQENNDITQFDFPHSWESNENRTIIDDDFGGEVIRRHSVRKREVLHDDLDTENYSRAIYNEESTNLRPNPFPGQTQPEFYTRTTRDTEWDINMSKKNVEYYVKVLVVADKTMLKYHGSKEELTRYILILMSHVALLYKEASIGNAISISVVQIRTLGHDDFSNYNSSEILRKFCEWQQRNVIVRRHDVALLLTRQAICRNSSAQVCSTLGVAEVGSICRSSGCAVIRDKGLSSSYTIAHELGHVLGMLHDEDKVCEPFNNGKKNTIMSKAMQNDTKPFIWSGCSKYSVTEFLDSRKAQCLMYPPSTNEILSNYTNMLPGDTIEADRQCELEFGPGHKLCPFKTIREPPCTHLWCINKNGECLTQFSPWAEGTKCGPNSWCYRRECRAEDRRQLFVPIDGGWGDWQEWGSCSRTCGGGIKMSKRYCDSPRPENGGSYCTGKSVQYASCNTQDCEPNANDFRAEQCAAFNGLTRNLPDLRKDVQWIPKYGLGSPEEPDDYCKLYCRPKNSPAYYLLKEKVADGTKCGLTSFDICVNGICRPGGCDNKLESTMVLDECGECGGDNSKCQEVIGNYNTSSDQAGYTKVVRIPKGSSNIYIEQNRHGNPSDENFLALVDGETGAYILNDNFMLITQDTDILFGSLIIKYSGSSAFVEWLRTPKNHKLSKDLILEVLSVGNLAPPDITYRYLISKEAAPRYGWTLYQKQWSKCSSICEGMQSRKPVCVDLATGTEVQDRFCDHSDMDEATERQQCNTHCELTWNVVQKSACSPHCGKGYRRVYYNCMKINKKKQGYSEVVNEKHCYVLEKPPESEPCETLCNSTRWEYTAWSVCTKTCGGGIQRRIAKCIDAEQGTVIDDVHCSNSEKITEQICNTEKCPIWFPGDKSECSVPCGGGYRNLTYYCVLSGRIYETSACDLTQRPRTTESCNEKPCRWELENSYYPCSVSCGKGVEKRKVTCKTYNQDTVDQEYCRKLPVPNDSRPCYRECDKLSYERRHVYNDINDNSIHNYDRYTFRWVAVDWTPCSQTCNGGVSSRTHRCKNVFGEENEKMCNRHLKPDDVIVRCNDEPCPRPVSWKTGDWSPNCDSECEKHRQVRCMDEAMTIVEDSRCDMTKKPINSMKCKLSQCSQYSKISRNYFDVKENEGRRYRWRVGAWKQCSNSCGKGLRRRHIQCEDTLNNITLVDSLCAHLRKPKTTKPCERYNCKYAWLEGYWSPCSTTCDQGVKTRNVTCHRVHPGGIIDPVPLPDLNQNKIYHKNYCPLSTKPATSSKCLLSRCGDKYVWKPEPWKQCSHQCGRKGRQIRMLNCVGATNNNPYPKYFCPKALKPPRKRKCNQWRCLYRSCKEIKHYLRTTENRDYVISIQGRPTQIYCYKMDTPDPLEYISLHPDTQNFAEIYDKRLGDIQTCPYNGERKDNCPCDNIGPERSGTTRFWKVRLNVTSLQIIGDDFTFSKQVKGRKIAYGTAGDCYSAVKGCTQGQFSVDLSHTSFSLSRYVRWRDEGEHASSNIHLTATTANGKCGGYCGNCAPDPEIGLAVEIT